MKTEKEILKQRKENIRIQNATQIIINQIKALEYTAKHMKVLSQDRMRLHNVIKELEMLLKAYIK